MVSEPGTQWCYNGGATALLGRLIAQGSGLSLREYAEEKLLAPLGVADCEWVQGSDGEFGAASGLRLRPCDLAKIGQLVLDGGRWRRTQIVPAAWLEQSFRTRAKVNDIVDYGYHGGSARSPQTDSAGSPGSATAGRGWPSCAGSIWCWWSWPATTISRTP